ncbi:hypothetical protein [Sporomusa malonica]|uniref:Pyruvate-formate lyase-activating enzyme n=1 Tax=Sporomusa malonica TaxID=112901 RepID=A0A1W2DQT1_9FIRM|nr:hypothetical protein [Sporomusa malonica]SMC99837.1 Pyruvate-formate lyase-activating enzyme [Sporomusa malonica]
MKCNYCEWRCDLGPQTLGVCRMYHLSEGAIKERFPHKWRTYDIAQIESLPFYHAYPGSRSMTLGTVGSNIGCSYYTNTYITKEDPASLQGRIRMYNFTPAELIHMAQKLGCHNIVFNVNEPTVSLPSLLEVSHYAKKAGIPLGCLTNAYMTEEATVLFASMFSFININLLGLSSCFCRNSLGIPDSLPILRNVAALANLCHLEVSTPVIQSVNDHELDEIAAFLLATDRYIPWHVFSLLPEHKTKEIASSSIDSTHAILTKYRKVLPYVYFHNFIDSDWVNTQCPCCEQLVIERIGGNCLTGYHCLETRCPRCGQDISILVKQKF